MIHEPLRLILQGIYNLLTAGKMRALDDEEKIFMTDLMDAINPYVDGNQISMTKTAAKE
jgi:hypothetical protein